MKEDRKFYKNPEDFLSSSFQSHTNLEIKLSNSDNNFKQESCLGSLLQSCQNIANLKLLFQEAVIRDIGAQVLSSDLEKFTNLSKLVINLKQEQFSLFDYQYCFIQNLYSFLYINIKSNNSISQLGVQSLSSSLKKYTKLSKLKLHFHSNEIGIDGIKALGSAIIQLPNLQSLDISFQYSNIGNQGLNEFVEYLVNCTQLTKLNLYLCSNDISLEGIQSLGYMVSKCVNLQDIYLDLAQGY
ncbi:hypothetical protein ABPG73_017009 [Tetrahymena malaccensis]